MKAHKNEAQPTLDLARKLNIDLDKTAEWVGVSREERKREASKPLYLIRYE